MRLLGHCHSGFLIAASNIQVFLNSGGTSDVSFKKEEPHLSAEVWVRKMLELIDRWRLLGAMSVFKVGDH